MTGKPGMLQSVGLQRVGHDLVTEQQQPSFTSGSSNPPFLLCYSLPSENPGPSLCALLLNRTTDTEFWVR